jgi:hypothetical protein
MSRRVAHPYGKEPEQLQDGHAEKNKTLTHAANHITKKP